MNEIFINTILLSLYEILKKTNNDSKIYMSDFRNHSIAELDDLRKTIITNQLAKHISKLGGDDER